MLPRMTTELNELKAEMQRRHRPIPSTGVGVAAWRVARPAHRG
jgi:hypothetical protein